MRFKKFLLSLTILMLIFLLTSISAQQVYVMKFSWIDPPDPMGQSTSGYGYVLKSEVERLSAGRIKVELYPAGQLGDQRSSVEQVRKGTIEACNISSGVLASLYYPELGVFDLPFVFTSREHAVRVLNSSFAKKIIEDCAQKTGIRILSLQAFGFRYLFNSKKPIKTPDDVKGMKIRVMEIVPHQKLIEALGGTPVPMPMLELYTALQTKVVDGAENTLQNIVAQKYYQIQKYLTLTGHLMGIGATLINEKWYQSLPLDLKVALVEGEKVARMTYHGLGELLDDLALSKLKEAGMEIYSPTASELKQFKDKTLPYVRKWMEKELGTKLVSDFLREVEKAKADIQKEVKATEK